MTDNTVCSSGNAELLLGNFDFAKQMQEIENKIMILNLENTKIFK